MYIPWSPSIQDVHNSSVEMSPLVNGSLSKEEKHFSAYAWRGSSLHPTFYLVGTCDRTMWECSNRALESCRELLVCTLVMYVCMYVCNTHCAYTQKLRHSNATTMYVHTMYIRSAFHSTIQTSQPPHIHTPPPSYNQTTNIPPPPQCFSLSPRHSV